MLRWIALAIVLLLFAGTWWIVQTTDRTAGVAGPSSSAEGAAAPAGPEVERPEVDEGGRDAAPEPTADRDAPDAQPSIEPEGAGIELLVLGEGKPVAGARVTTFEDSRPGEHLTDEDGVCRLPIEPSVELLRLLVEAEGFFHAHVHYSRAERLKLELAPAAVLSGRLLDAEHGFPLPGAYVELVHGYCKGCGPERAVAGEDGRFELPCVPLDRGSTFLLRAEGYPPDTAAIRLRGERVQEHDFRLERGLGIEGRVVDLMTGEPIAGAEILNVERGDTRWRADRDGRFSARLLRSTLRESIELEVRSEGTCRLRASIDPEEAPEGAELSFPLVQGARFAGVVLDEEGAPVAGADLGLAEPPGRDRLEGAPDPNPLDALPPGCHYEFHDHRSFDTTDGQGTFDMGACLPWSGPWGLRVRHSPHLAKELDLGHLGGPGETTWIEIRLEPAPATGILSGSISVNGEPRAGRIRWNGSTRSGMVRVDVDGLFRIEDVEAGRVELDPRPELLDWGGPPAPGMAIAIELPPGEERVHDFDLELHMTSISGRVRSPQGEPLEGMRVTARRQGGHQNRNAQTAADGGYAVEIPATGELYDVVASNPPLWERKDGVAEGAEHVDFVLSRVGRISYRPVDPETGANVPSFDVYWRPTGEKLYRSLQPLDYSPDPEGWFQSDVAVGTVDFMARADMLGYRPLLVPAQAIPVEGSPEPLLLELQRGLEIELRLAEGLEAPPEGTHVFLLETAAWAGLRYDSEEGWEENEHYPSLSHTHRSLHFDDSGRAKLIGLFPGPHRFKVFPPDIAIEPETLDLTGEEREPILIRWRRVE